MRELPSLPPPRGPLSQWVGQVLAGEPVGRRPPVGGVDALVDDDLHLALHCCYELSVRGFTGVDPALEDDDRIHDVRRHLEGAFESALRHRTGPPSSEDPAVAVTALLSGAAGPSLSRFLAGRGTAQHLREFLVHRSAYQLKEADAHTWALPRLTPGRRKAAYVEIQADEYGGGVPGRSHAELFAAAMVAAGLDARYGHYVPWLPGTTLATDNLVTMLGRHQRHRGALVGHLAAFEMTSVGPMGRYAAAADRLGFPPAVRHFYDVHVEADTHHGDLARTVLLGGDAEAEGLDPADLFFGAAALVDVEDRFTRRLLRRWRSARSSLLVPERRRARRRRRHVTPGLRHRSPVVAGDLRGRWSM